jgi:hypothetical protein
MIHGNIDVSTLTRLYIDEGLSTYKIAERYKCDPKTVYFHLKRNRIETRKKKEINLSKTELKDLYLNKRESLARIGMRYGFSAAGILKKLKEYNIPRRSTSETNIKHKKYDFRGDKIEQAYLTGFRLGDLGVRQRGNLIYVSSSTTKEPQALLIKDLFRRYGPIWESKKNPRTYAWNISIALNETFQFLLPKHSRIPAWVMRSNPLLLAFMAGYTDAEGNFQIANGTARFRIRSYDFGILEGLHIWMTRYEIPHTFTLVSKAGLRSGTKQNKDCWGLIIANKQGLDTLLPKLLPLLRHAKRKLDARLALENVRRRMK